MTAHKPKVTVLMPAYNAANYIGEAIDSVLQQTFTDFELLIINDGSTDNTKQVIESYDDNRIILIGHLVNHGIAAALNTGLSKANGEYIARFDADDICVPERLQEQVSFLDNHPDYVLTGSDAEYISENGEHLFYFKSLGHTHEQLLYKIYSHCPFIHSSVMYRKDPVIEAGGYSLHAHNFEDYFLWIQLKKYGKFNNLQKRLIKVRFNPSSSTIDEKWRGKLFREIKKKIIKRGTITKEEGEVLFAIIKKQNVQKIKEGAYYALCGKKFLIDNHQPKKARPLLSKAIKIHPYRWDNYALYMLSYFPGSFINWLHKIVVPKINAL
ncbi:MAG TPA: glycosyltransferase [Ginsengibacter sp.]